MKGRRKGAHHATGAGREDHEALSALYRDRFLLLLLQAKAAQPPRTSLLSPPASPLCVEGEAYKQAARRSGPSL